MLQFSSTDQSYVRPLLLCFRGGMAVVLCLGVSLLALKTNAGGTALNERPAPPDAVSPADSTLLYALRAPADTTEGLQVPTPYEPDTLEAEADTVTSFPRVERYIDRSTRQRYRFLDPAPLVSPEWSFWRPKVPLYRHEVTSDTLAHRYEAQVFRGREEHQPRRHADRSEYLQARREQDIRQNWRDLEEQRRQDRQRDDGAGVGMNIAIPGGQESPFSTVFGSPEVDLRVTGNANIDAGLNYNSNERQAAVTGTPYQIDPDFKQDLQLGITGTIGDKLTVDVNWDTHNEFDFQNQVRLEYAGYDDEILQSVEAGNVFLETPSSLIRGGQSLFGLKSELQFGDLSLTAIASQQEGESGSMTIEGGAERTRFDMKPTRYDDNMHFFLGYYFRNRWDDALSDPPNIRLESSFSGITDIEVWKLRTSANPDDEDVRRAVGVVDLGEPERLLREGRNFTAATIDSLRADVDQYSEGDLQTMRDPDTGRSFFENRGLREADYEAGYYQRLEEGRDYDFDRELGYVSLRQRLQDNEALAVAFRYERSGQTVEIGDLIEAGGTSGGRDADRLVLKLLRPSPPAQPGSGQGEAAWHLQMRNIYPLSGRNLEPADFELEVLYDPPAQPATSTLPNVTEQTTLLQLLGLDRITSDGARQPDDNFDFIPGFTINPERGLLIFPHVEPFGERLAEAIDEEVSDPAEAENLREQYVFESLYNQRKRYAEDDTERNVYTIRGSYRGSMQDFYDLQALGGIVDGSVTVSAGGQTLQEGTDYSVDYQSGTVTILNERLLQGNRTLNIDYEQNSLFNIEQKTLLGARADYTLRDDLALGATVMRMSERSPVDKYRIGEEPIANTIWGLDGALDLDANWLTAGLNALPILQTSTVSNISLSGEFAQLIPGHTRTTAYDRTRRGLREDGRDFDEDVLQGVSYIDDFENFENTFSLMGQPQAWQISSAPATFRPPGMEGAHAATVSDSASIDWRAGIGWYQLNQNIVDELRGKTEAYNPDAVRLLDIQEVFPNRDTRGEINTTLNTFDIYYDPNVRGPYNYSRDLESFFQQPENTWGGMVRKLPDGYNDFGVQNVEFVEFIFKPYPENPQEDAGEDAKLYLDLGTISEDILGNERLSTEDGLSVNSFDPGAFEGPFRLATRQALGTITIENNRTNDLGIDGLVSYNPDCYDDQGRYTDCVYPEIVSEHYQFSSYIDYVNQVGQANPLLQAEAARTLSDPSADEYHHYGNDDYFQNTDFFPDGATFQQRFLRYHSAMELNSYEGQNTLAQNTTLARGVSRDPSTEDLNSNGVLDTENSYFQYRIPLSQDSLEAQAQQDDPDNYVVGEIQGPDGSGTGWYQVRIPVQRYTDRVGNIQDFSLIESMRLWTTGHEVPITMRFAKMELVGSEWRTSERLPLREDPETGEPIDLPSEGDAPVFISSVNNEENSDIYIPPPGAIVSQEQTTTGARRNAREQSMSLQVEDLEPGMQRGVFKTYTQGLNLLRYSNLRMHAHLHGRLADGTNLADLAEQNREEARDHVRLFVRMGSNQTGDYYEYEQPLTPSRPGRSMPDSLWLPDENEMRLLMSALNQLKVARDNAAVNPSQIFYSDGEMAEEFGVPDPEEFAPDGTRIGIKGNPSLQNVTSVVIGIRNASQPANGPTIENATLWFNELRVSDYDEQSGWAAIGDADIRLADVGRISANIRTQTDGFGALSSTLNERQQDDVLDWNITGDLDAGRFLPQTYGWEMPVSAQIQSQTATPRFSPQRGDVRLEEIFAQIDARPDLTEQEKEEQRMDALHRAQDRSYQQSFTARLQKNNSDNWLVRNTLDRISLNYNFASNSARNPSQRFSDGWSWNTNAQYRINLREPRTISPFGFLDGIPLLGLFSDTEFNYAPQSFTFSASANRRYSERQPRRFSLPTEGPALPEQIRSQHDFGHDRQLSFQYNPFQFLNFNYSSNVAQSLDPISADSSYTVFSREDGTIREQNFVDRLRAEQELARLDQENIPGFRQDHVSPIPAGTLAQQLIQGMTQPRSNNYRQRLAATLRLPVFNRSALDWISMEDIGYQTTFNWRNGPTGRISGASVENRVELRSGLTLHPNRLAERIGLYSNFGTSALDDDEQGAFNPFRLAQDVLLAFTRIENFSINYTGDWRTNSSHVGQLVEGDSLHSPHSLLDALGGRGPSIGYRLGLDRDIGMENRVLDESLNVTDVLSSGHRVQARTNFNPLQQLQINLSWDTNWQSGRTTNFPTAEGDELYTTGSGDNSSTIWTFGGSYMELFDNQLATLESNLNQPSAEPSPGAEVALTNRSLTTDFRNAFVMNTGGLLDDRGLLPFPMPYWTVNYSGLSQLPFVRDVVQSVTLRHNYRGELQNNYQLHPSGTAGSVNSFSIAGQELRYIRPDFRAGSMTVNERFHPLVGIDLNWQGNLQTNLAYNRQRGIRLSTTNSQVTQAASNELTFSASYRDRGISLPFIPGTFENDLRFNLSLSIAQRDERRFSLRQALEEALSNPDVDRQDILHGDSVSPLLQTVRYRVTPSVAYQFSNRVRAEFTLEYEHLDGDNRRPSYTTVNGGFRVNVDVAN